MRRSAAFFATSHPSQVPSRRMRPGFGVRLVALLVSVIVSVLVGGVTPRGAHAQVFSDTFGDGVTGNFWTSFSSSPSLRIVEQNGRLEFFADADGSMTQMRFAGYEAKGWQLRPSGLIRARITFTQWPSGTLPTTGSRAGIAVSLGKAGVPLGPGGIPPGAAVALGAIRPTANSAEVRTFDVMRVDDFGNRVYAESAYAFLNDPEIFYDWNTNVPVAEIPIQTTAYLKYNPQQDLLYLSVSGYNDPNALVYSGVRGYSALPVKFFIGGWAERPGGLVGEDAWWDNFVIDEGQLETAVQNLAASDGSFTDRVRLTWSPAVGGAGYRIRRSDLAEPLAQVASNVVGYDDLSAAPGVGYEYTVETLTLSGFPIAASNAGWRNLVAPAGLSASDGTSVESVALTWTPVPGAISYDVRRSVGTAAATVIGTPTVAEFLDLTAVPGQTYTYTVVARCALGASAASASNTGWRSLLAPTGLTATSGTLSTGVQLAWTGAAGASGYVVLRSIDGGTQTTIGQPNATSFTDASAVAGTVYTYAVRAKSQAGNSEPSVPATGWRSLPAPANVQASDGTSTSLVTVTWNAVAGATTGYRVYRALGTGEAIELGEVGTTTTTFTDTSVDAGVAWNYTVRTLMSTGVGASSAPNSGWRNVPAPAGLAASDGESASSVALAWEPVAGATGYRVLRGTGSAVPTAVIASPSTTAFTDATATPGTVFSYAVRATTAPGDSATGSTDTGWRNLLPPATMTATDGTLTTGVQLNWSASSGATGYRIYRALGATEPTEQIGLSNGASYLDTSALAGVIYTYGVRAASAGGLTPLGATDVGFRGAPAPTGVAASDGTSPTGVTVTWQLVPGAISYEVSRTLGTAAETFVCEAPPFVDVSATPATIYSYKVRAITGVNPSAYSSPNTGWRNLPAPTDVVATDGTQTNGVQISWAPIASGPVTAYRVFRAAGTGTPAQVGQVGANVATYLDAGAVAGTSYTYTVRGVSTPGMTDPSGPDAGWRNVVAPANLVASTNLSTGVNLTWTASPGAAGYRVYRGVSAEELVEIAQPTAATFLDASAEVGVDYSYQVRARTAAGNSLPSLTRVGRRTMPAPTGIAASDGTSSDGVVVGWNQIPGVSNYRVLRATGSAVPTTPIGDVSSGLQFLDESAVAGTVYNYSVVGLLGASTSAPGVANSGWRNLPAPAGLSASDGSSVAGVVLTWNSVPGSTGYRIFRSLGTAAPVQIAQVVGAGSTAHTDTTAVAGTTYSYRVRAYTTPGNSDASAAVTGWRNVAAPVNLAATDGTSTAHVGVTWSAVAGAAGYRVYRSEAGGTFVEVAAPSTTTYLDAGAVPGVTYSYFARARTAAGDSIGQSNTNDGYRGMPAPTGVAAGDGTSTDGVPVAWAAVPGATEYRVFRSGTTAPVYVGALTSILDVPPLPGTSYTYTVRAFTPLQNGLLSVPSAGDAGWRNVPTPTGVSASNGTLTTGVTVTWTPVAPAAGITGYRVFRAAGQAAPVQIASLAASATTYSDTAAVAGTLYAYSVRAVVAAGLSGPSASDAGWRDVTPPASLTAGDGTSTASIALSWPAVAGATGYVVYRGESTMSLAELTTSSSATFADTTALPGTKYHYQVAAQTQAGLSTRRSPTNDGWRNVPAPTGVDATDGTSLSSVTITWNPVENATGYRVFRANGTATPTTQIAEINDPAIGSFVDAGAIAGARYNYAVKAKVAAPGDSALSAANGGFRGVPAPSNLAATDGTLTTGVSLTWSAAQPATGVTGYRIYRSGTATALATVALSATSYLDAAAVAGQSFTYEVRSVCAAGESVENPSDAGWRNLAAPTNVQATDGTVCGLVRVTWNRVNSPNVIGYRILRSIAGGAQAEIATVPQATAPSYDDVAPPIAPGQSGSYVVQVQMSPGNSGSSTANTGFPKICLTGDGSTAGSDGEDPSGESAEAEVGFSDEGDLERPIAPADPAGTGVDLPQGAPALPERPDSVDAGLIPTCKELDGRIRRILTSIGQRPSDLAGDEQDHLAARLKALLEIPVGEDGSGSAACRILAGDVNLDGEVDPRDLAAFLIGLADDDLVIADVDRSGSIDATDLGIVWLRIIEHSDANSTDVPETGDPSLED